MCLRYWSFIIDDDCTTIISRMFDILFIWQEEGDDTFLKNGVDRRKGDNS